MRFLFVHQNFPGQFLHLIRHLVAQNRHDVVFICESNRNHIAGVRRIVYPGPKRPEAPVHQDARDFAQAMARAEAVANAARQVKALGFTPDIIIGHHGWGELLNLGDVWPGAPLLGYHEFYYHHDSLDVSFDPEFPTLPAAYPQIRAKNAVNLLALTNPGHGQTPTRFQLNTYPAWSHPKIALLEEGVNLDVCRPQPARGAVSIAGVEIAPDDKLVTYVSRDLEPYRGFHQFMRALPALLRARPDARVVMVGGDGTSYGASLANGTWRELLLAQVSPLLDTNRLHFPGKIDYPSYIRLLQRSDAHVYLTYPFVLSWSLREAMACGCALVCSDTEPVREYVRDGPTGVLTPFFDPGALADRIGEVLDGGARITAMRRRARKWAEAHLDMGDYLARYEELIEQVAGQPVQPPLPAPRRAKPRARKAAAADIGLV